MSNINYSYYIYKWNITMKSYYYENNSLSKDRTYNLYDLYLLYYVSNKYFSLLFNYIPIISKIPEIIIYL